MSDHSDYLSEFHEDFLRPYMEEELLRQEKASNTFLNRPHRVSGRLATFEETQAMLDRLAAEEG
jgi:hypothetical protein